MAVPTCPNGNAHRRMAHPAAAYLPTEHPAHVGGARRPVKLRMAPLAPICICRPGAVRLVEGDVLSRIPPRHRLGEPYPHMFRAIIHRARTVSDRSVRLGRPGP